MLHRRVWFADFDHELRRENERRLIQGVNYVRGYPCSNQISIYLLSNKINLAKKRFLWRFFRLR